MDRLEHALQLERSGHFILALRELEHVSLWEIERPTLKF